MGDNGDDNSQVVEITMEPNELMVYYLRARRKKTKGNSVRSYLTKQPPSLVGTRPLLRIVQFCSENN